MITINNHKLEMKSKQLQTILNPLNKSHKKTHHDIWMNWTDKKILQ